jgi:hypothetical protein
MSTPRVVTTIAELRAETDAARAAGRDVFFLTGTDEHGLKVEQSAAARGVPGLDLLGACLWAPLCERLLAQPLAAFFSPALPAVFPSNFCATQTLLRRLRR